MVDYFSPLTSIYPARMLHKENFTHDNSPLQDLHLGLWLTFCFSFLSIIIPETISYKTQINSLILDQGVFDDPLKNP